MKKFVLEARKIEYAKHTEGAKVRLSTEAYNTLVDMTNASTVPMSKIASQAIMYAFENLSLQERAGK